jgi:hypothetical protein
VDVRVDVGDDLRVVTLLLLSSWGPGLGLLGWEGLRIVLRIPQSGG